MLSITENLRTQFIHTRKRTEQLCEPIEIEDFVVQPVDFASPPKWHLAHTTWYFEQFVLTGNKKNYKVFDKDFAFLFNSYYESVGNHWIRANRGNLSRPTVSQVRDYRRYVTAAIEEFFEEGIPENVMKILEIGIHHEQQHQELLLTDLKYTFGHNPLFPVYNADFEENPLQEYKQEWLNVPEGVYEIGLTPDSPGFRYDNEMGRHKVYLNEFAISNKLVTNREYLEFMNDGGYSRVLLWHSPAWTWLEETGIRAPLYWFNRDGKWYQYTLAGLKELNPDAPVAHISYYEAFAFAQWKGMRLLSEAEWEVSQNRFDWGSRWEWTESAYLAYPGYVRPEGAIGEYNAKFMVNQKVLRGGSVATTKNHSRPTYRNFFHAPERWQFFGIRLAR